MAKEYDVSAGKKRKKKKLKGKSGKTDLSQLAKEVRKRTLKQLAFEGMRDYAMEANLERAVPDLLDGLKPVHRRTLFQASRENSRSDPIGVKTARLIGAVTGRLHPHGESSVLGACETLWHQPTSPLSGKGNWGSLLDSAAAARYTHCTLSNYGWSFFDPDYIHKEVTPFVPNYDDTDMEPVSLPAMLPNVLLNGGSGIGVGLTTNIPTFTPESLIPLVVRLFKKEKLTIEDFEKALKFAHRWGGHMVKSKKNKTNFRQLMKYSDASIEFEADIDVDRNAKSITVRDWAPGANILTFVEKVRMLKQTADVYNTNGLEYVIEMRRDYNFNQFDHYVEQVQKLTRTRQSFNITVTHRTVKEVDGVYEYDTALLMCSVPELIMLWCKERLELEKRSLHFRVTRLQEQIDYSKLLIYTADKIKLIVPYFDKKDVRKLIMKKLKLTEAQVDTLMQLRLQQLTRLDQDVLKDKLKKQIKEMKQLVKWQKAPRKKIAGDLDAMMPLLKEDRVIRAKKTTEKLTLAA